jgi:outer membrane protein TolC
VNPDPHNWIRGGQFSVTLGWTSFGSLLPFTKEGQALKDTDNQIKIARIGLAQMEQGTELNIRNTVNTLESAKSSAEASSLTVKMAQDSYNQTETAYRNGLQTYIEVENAANSLSQAKLALLQQEYNYLNGLVDLEYYTGVPFGSLSKQTSTDTTGTDTKKETTPAAKTPAAKK